MMFNKNARKGIGKQGARLLSSISSEKRTDVFTLKDAHDILGMKGVNLRQLLFGLKKNKWIASIERGKYLILALDSGPTPGYGTHPYLIARKLVSPYYVAFVSALNYYGITEQVAGANYLATTKSKRPLKFLSDNYRFVRFSEKRFFGMREEWIGNLKFNISDKEKTIIDCLYMPEYSGGLTEVVKAFREKLDFELMYNYAIRMDDLATLKRLGYLLEILNIKTPVAEKLLDKVGGGYCLLDTCGPKSGIENKKWRIRVNIGKEELRLEL